MPNITGNVFSDSFGNCYYNGATQTLNGLASSHISLSEELACYQNGLGNTTFIVDGGNFGNGIYWYFKFNHTFDQGVNLSTGNSRARFIKFDDSYYYNAIHPVRLSTNSAGTTLLNMNVGLQQIYTDDTLKRQYAVISPTSVAWFTCNATNSGSRAIDLTKNYAFHYIGYLDNLLPGLATLGSLVAVTLNKNGALVAQCGENILALATGSGFNYPIQCQSSTPGANIAEFYLRYPTIPHQYWGSLKNIIKYDGILTVGNIYRNPGIDPDGNTEQIRWLCVGVTETTSLLMRIYFIE